MGLRTTATRQGEQTWEEERGKTDSSGLLRKPQLSWRDLIAFATTKALQTLPYEFCKKHSLLPLAVIEGGEKFLTILSNTPPSLETVKELRFLAGMEVEIETTSVDGIEFAIEAAYTCSEDAIRNLHQKLLKSPAQEPTLPDLTSEAAIPKLLELLITKGAGLGASDLHLEQREETLRIRYRVDGILRDDYLPSLKSGHSNQLFRRIKLLAGIDTLELSKPADGSFEFAMEKKRYSLRVAIIPVVGGEKAVIRYLEADSSVLRLEDVGLLPSQLFQFQTSLARDSGCILLSGPTGSGKTTLLYAALEYLKNPGLNIMTIEDPVERQLEGITQIQANSSVGLGFPELLRALLRQDPDIIMIGEIRERHTAETALQAAITGHLVLSTVHASNVFEILIRLRQLVCDQTLIARPLQLLSSQRLVPKNCPSCQRQVKLSPRLERFFGIPQGTLLSESTGCSLCAFSGIKGRVAVYEILPLTQCLREAIERGQSLSELLEIAKDIGYVPYQFPIRDKLLLGLISPAQALRALGAPATI